MHNSYADITHTQHSHLYPQPYKHNTCRTTAHTHKYDMYTTYMHNHNTHRHTHHMFGLTTSLAAGPEEEPGLLTPGTKSSGALSLSPFGADSVGFWES